MKKKKPVGEEIVLEFVEAVEDGEHQRALTIKLEPKGFLASLKHIEKGKTKFWKMFASLLIENSPKAAEKIFRKITQVDPKDHEAYYSLANLLRESGRLNEAERAFKEAISLAPNEPHYHYFMGTLYWQKGDIEKVEKKLRDSIKADRDFYLGYASLGGLLDQRGAYEEAEKILKDGIEVNKSFADLKYNLAVVLEHQDKLEEAEKAYRESIILNPKNPLPHNNLANVLWTQGKLEEVEKEYRKAIALNNKEPRHYLNLLRFLKSKNKIEEMKKVLNKMLENQVIDSNAHDIVGGTLAENNEMKEAEKMYRRALDIDPKNPYPYNNLANSFQKRGNLLDAYELFKEGIKNIGSIPPRDQIQITTNFAGLLRELGYFYDQQGNHKETLSIVEEIIELVEQNKVFRNLKNELLADAHLLSGNIFLKKEKPRKAIQEFQKASNYKPNDARIWFNLSHQYYTLRKPYHALQAVRRALKFKPDYSEAKELYEAIKRSKLPKRIKWWRYVVSSVIFLLGVAAFCVVQVPFSWIFLIIGILVSSVVLFSPYIKKAKPKYKVLGQELELEIEPPEKSEIKIISIEDRQSLPEETFKNTKPGT